MLGLGLRGLKRAGEDGNFNILQDLKMQINKNVSSLTLILFCVFPLMHVIFWRGNIATFVPLASAGG